MKSKTLFSAVGFGCILALSVPLSLSGCKKADTLAGATTLGDVRAVHADVRIGEHLVQGRERLSDGQRLLTGPEGRARVRLDDGTLVAVDANTALAVHGHTLELESGRVFVQGGPAAHTDVTLGKVSTTVSSSAVAFERRGAASKIYCAQGEVALREAGG